MATEKLAANQAAKRSVEERTRSVRSARPSITGGFGGK